MINAKEARELTKVHKDLCIDNMILKKIQLGDSELVIESTRISKRLKKKLLKEDYVIAYPNAPTTYYTKISW